MPRNSSGTYTLPGAVNPVVTGTPIATNWGNTTLNDLASEVTNSLDRSGRGSMQAALKLIDGSAGTPGLSFGAESTTGLFRAGTNLIGVAVGGTEKARFGAAGFGVGGTPTVELDVLVAQARLRLNSTTATNPPELLFARAGAIDAYLGSVGTINDLVTGSGVGDVALRSESHNILFSANAGASIQFLMDAAGRLSGNALHNNASAPTGTSRQYVASGTYTPVPVAVSNCSAPSGNKCTWTRVGNVVHVSGSVQITVTAGGSLATEVDVPLPIASNLGAFTDLAGAFVVNILTSAGAQALNGDAVTDRARMIFGSNSTGIANVWFSFSYEVL